jgi:hypothetical protein
MSVREYLDCMILIIKTPKPQNPKTPNNMINKCNL